MLLDSVLYNLLAAQVILDWTAAIRRHSSTGEVDYSKL